LPIAAAVARLDPLTAANIAQPATDAMARPPYRRDSQTRAA
jgi:hypothetical protein